jgi:glycine C-acetyltransferase
VATLDRIRDEVARLKADGVYREPPVLAGRQGARATVQGRPVINLASNNYLGLATHPRLVAAMVEATERLGVGSGAVRTIVGTMEIHLELERRLAAFKSSEAALVFQSGFATNLAVVPNLAGEGDGIFSDALNHASIIDGCRQSRAEVVRFAHADVEDLERQLKSQRGRFRHGVVVTDGVFSMDGDVAPLPEIVALAEAHDATVYVDDAHGSGVMGPGGRGTVAHYGLEGRVEVQVGTLSKAIGVLGGYVATSRPLVELLEQRGRPFLFSTSHPPGVAAACLAALDVMADEPERIERLWENTRHFKAGLERLGFDIGRSQTPITPVMAFDERRALALSDQLLEAGVFAQGIVFPTVARGKARVRTIVTAEHTAADLDEALEAFGRVGRTLDLIG